MGTLDFVPGNPGLSPWIPWTLSLDTLDFLPWHILDCVPARTPWTFFRDIILDFLPEHPGLSPWTPWTLSLDFLSGHPGLFPGHLDLVPGYPGPSPWTPWTLSLDTSWTKSVETVQGVQRIHGHIYRQLVKCASIHIFISVIYQHNFNIL